MPLHAITSVHGEAGLRKRLAIEIAGFPARAGKMAIEQFPGYLAAKPGGRSRCRLRRSHGSKPPWLEAPAISEGQRLGSPTESQKLEQAT
jgi:hypothetical protein